jgi:hypothetical protein
MFGILILADQRTDIAAARAIAAAHDLLVYEGFERSPNLPPEPSSLPMEERRGKSV